MIAVMCGIEVKDEHGLWITPAFVGQAGFLAHTEFEDYILSRF
jgi:hypothetical protein